MNVTSDRKVIMALFIIFALCLVGAAVCIYRAEANNMKSLQVQLRDNQRKLTDVKEKITRISQSEIEFQQLRQRLDFLEKPLPDAAYIPTFLQQIEVWAVETHNQIVMIRPKKKLTKVNEKAGGVKMNNETGEIVKEEEQAADSGEKKDTAKKEVAKQELPYDFIPIELKMEGTYWTTLEFLKQMQRFPKMIAVNTVSFAPRATLVEADSRSSVMTINFELMAVVMKGAKDGQP